MFTKYCVYLCEDILNQCKLHNCLYYITDSVIDKPLRVDYVTYSLCDMIIL